MLKSRTGGISLISLILLIGGIACLTIQIAGFFGETAPNVSLGARFAPALLALLLFLLFFWTGRRGNTELYSDRIQGKKASGKRYAVLLKDIETVDLNGRQMLLKGKDKQVLLLDKAPAYRRMPGLIWMLVQYPELGDAIGRTFVQETFNPGAIRMFSEGENDLSGDAGFLAKSQSEAWYLPMTDTKPAPRPIDNQKSLSTNLQPGNPILKFDPNPGRLPLREVWSALSKGSEEEQGHWLELLAEAHGGVKLQENGDIWLGELNGMQVRVHVPGTQAT